MRPAPREFSAQTTGIPSGNTSSKRARVLANSGLCRASPRMWVLEGQTAVARGRRASILMCSSAVSYVAQATGVPKTLMDGNDRCDGYAMPDRGDEELTSIGLPLTTAMA